MHDITFHSILVRIACVLEDLAGLEGGECSRHHKKTRKKDPCKCGSQNVVQSWDLIEMQEHFHISCLHTRYSYEMIRPRRGNGRRALRIRRGRSYIVRVRVGVNVHEGIMALRLVVKCDG